MSLIKNMLARNILISLIVFLLFGTGCTSSNVDSRFGIIFTSNINGNQDIYRLRIQDPKSVERLTFTPNDLEQPVIPTKNGDQILFYLPDPSQDRIRAESLSGSATDAHTYVLNVNTKTVTDVASATLNRFIPNTWTVDEKQIVLTDVKSKQLQVMNSDGTKIDQLEIPHTYQDSIIEFVKFSPDGTQIAFTEIDMLQLMPATHALYTSFVYNLTNGTVLPVGDSALNCMNPKWSPTALQIALACTPEAGKVGTATVTIIDLGKDKHSSLNVAADFKCYSPVWSPSGTQIALICRKEENLYGLFLANSDGTNFNEIAISEPEQINIPSQLSWSPDGRYIVFTAGADRESADIYITNLDGKENYALTTTPSSYDQLSTYPLP